MTCPLHPDLADNEIEMKSDHRNYPKCGCYTTYEESNIIHRHSFRFFPGDKVQHCTWKGFKGVVDATSTDPSHPFIDWHEPFGEKSNSMMWGLQSNFDIRHLEPAREVTSQ